MQDDIEIYENIATTPARTAEIVSSGKWKSAAHLELIDSELFKACLTPNYRLMVNLPPRHGKSELISKYFPFWFLGRFPDKQVIFASYEATFAASWGRKVRDLVKNYGKALFDISVREDNSAVQRFSLIQGGSMSCVGAGGPVTGKGADLLIIDDPVKNDAEANSPTFRENAWDWFNATAYTRLEPGGILILVMTRWHEDDLAGRILKRAEETGEKWSIINLPSLAKEDDILGRKPGAPLWPERFDEARLNRIKKQIGSYWFSALYQQSPSPESGGAFKRENIKYYSEQGDFSICDDGKRYLLADCPTMACADLATKTGERCDYTVILIFRITPNREVFIKEIIRGRYSAADHLNILKSAYYSYNLRLIGIESVQYQIALTQAAAREGMPVKELRPDKDKFTRSLPISAMMEAGRVYFNKNMNNLSEFEAELLSFPTGTHDDQADAFSYIYNMINYGESSLPASAKTKRK